MVRYYCEPNLDAIALRTRPHGVRLRRGQHRNIYTDSGTSLATLYLYRVKANGNTG